MAKRVELDLYYLQHWSLTFDLQIILMTVFSGIFAQNAY
jgi:putative colanic acid biosynthesis UDP-glucose lipid carrier transferase